MQYSLNQEGRWGSGIDGFPTSNKFDTRGKCKHTIQWGLTTRKVPAEPYGELSGKTLPILQQ